MAELNIKGGFTRIPNDILEALCGLGVSGSEMRVLLYIIRRTYGFNTGSAEIPLSAIGNAVGMSRVNVSKVLKKLNSAGLISRSPENGNNPRTYSLSPDIAGNRGEVSSEKTTVVRNSDTNVVSPDDTCVVNNNDSSVVSLHDNTYKETRKEKYKERERKRHGHYGNVRLSDDEFRRLTDDYGESNTCDYIRKVDAYVQCKGRDYQDYEAVLRKWMEDDKIRNDDIDVSKYEQFINDF